MPQATTAPPSATSGTVTTRFRLALLWILFSATNYGYGISELNALQPILTCHSRDSTITDLVLPIATGCIPLTESQFGLVTSLFTLGGLVSSFLISPVSKSLGWGRKTCITWSSIAGIAGGSVLGLSSGIGGLGMGRFFQGLGSGIGVVMVPIFLNEISPVALKGNIGVLNQFSIVLGIFVAQAIGASWLGSDGKYWRAVPLTSGLVSLLQLVATYSVGLESPGWLEGEGKAVVGSGTVARDRADEIRSMLWSAKEVQSWKEGRSSGGARTDEERQGLLAGDSEYEDTNSTANRSSERHQVGLMGLFKDPEVKPGAILIVLTQLGQQLSGINAVLYYSVGILGSILPALAGSIGILITVINIIMTFPPIYLIDEHRVGRKSLMVGSAIVMSVASALLGAGIVYGYKMITNFLVGSAFLPVKNMLASYDQNHTGGAVFYIFSLTNLITAIVVARMYRYNPE
uniref:Related to VPS73-protein involved in vacuolar protein sorting n=1 Tax=Melanopsichium pennsylvanicum 4 TaxID=1398559 RepID=A0A077QSE4_9BASI|nr:related to VPS73-protein involved in vacuolar protein sorting [Melanopsichium pennsylvanicum 4]